MAVTINSITVAFGPSFDAAKQSIDALGVILSEFETPELPPCLFDDGGVLIEDFSNLIFREPFGGTATGARKLDCLQVDPSDWYLELCAAVVGDGDKHVARVVHGWPILSVGGRTTELRPEGRGVNSRPKGEA